MSKRVMVLALFSLALTSGVQAAGYMKIGAIKGESKDHAKQTEVCGKQKKRSLLLPAVQKVRASTNQSSKKQATGKQVAGACKHKKGKVEASWKVEEGEG